MEEVEQHTLLKQGAEGKLYIGNYQGRRCLVKERFVKRYRHPDLDKQLTRQRIKAEQKAFQRCAETNIATPALINVDLVGRKLYMEYLEQAKTAKQYIEELMANGTDGVIESNEIGNLTREIGRVVGLMHKNNFIHGDLTTSNVLLDPLDGENHTLPYRVVMIDFGLSHYSDNSENKGVDLYVLERALLSAHSQLPELFDKILASYREHNNNRCEDTIAKFEEVRARGRKRTMVG